MKTIIFIIFATQIYKVENNENFIKELKTEEAIEFFVNFLRNFHEFHIVFHADTTTINFVNDVVHLLNSYVSVEVYNQDTYKNDYSRPNASYIVNVLTSQNSQYWSALNSHLNLKNNDVLVFVGWTSALQTKIIEGASELLKLAGNTLAVELPKQTETNYSIYRTCYYCGLLSKKFVLLSTTNTTEMVIDLFELLPNNFRDLNGHLLHVVYVQYYPFAYCIAGKIKEIVFDGRRLRTCLNIKGIESNFIREMSQKLNFSLLIHTLDGNGTFFDMIKHVNTKKADIAFGGISLVNERVPYVLFSKQYNVEDYVFLYVLKLTFLEIFDKFTEPFRAVLVWMLYVAAFFLLSLALYIFITIDKGCGEQDKSLGYVLWVFAHMPFEQSMPGLDAIFPTHPSMMIILGLWWWSSLIMCTLYKGSMLSIMVNPPNTEPEDLQQLVQAGYTFAGNLQHQDIVAEILGLDDPIYKEALSKTIYADDSCAAFESTLKGGVAMLDEVSEIQFELRTICTDVDEDLEEKFRITRKSVRSTGHSWAMQYGAPYKAGLDYYLALVLSGGLYKKWTKDETMQLKSNIIPRSREMKSSKVRKLSLKRLMPVIVIYSSGICIAVIGFLIEIIVYHFKKLKIKNNM